MITAIYGVLRIRCNVIVLELNFPPLGRKSYTVEPLLTDPPRCGRPPQNGQTTWQQSNVVYTDNRSTPDNEQRSQPILLLTAQNHLYERTFKPSDSSATHSASHLIKRRETLNTRELV